eukprot:scaffold119249_cov30-Tisochrysis_lutea.AAC.2
MRPSSVGNAIILRPLQTCTSFFASAHAALIDGGSVPCSVTHRPWWLSFSSKQSVTQSGRSEQVDCVWSFSRLLTSLGGSGPGVTGALRFGPCPSSGDELVRSLLDCTASCLRDRSECIMARAVRAARASSHVPWRYTKADSYRAGCRQEE